MFFFTIVKTTSSSFKDFAHIHKSLQEECPNVIFKIGFGILLMNGHFFPHGSPVWLQPGRLLSPTLQLQDPFPLVLRCT